jgi:ribonuclease HII
MACDFSREAGLHARGIRPVAGVDEAGRGPLAGPVVAAAVILPEDGAPDGLDDSKKLSPARREQLFAALIGDPRVRFAVGSSYAGEIDALNILRATHLAMRRALAALDPQAIHVLVDGRPVPDLPAPQTALVGGDGLSLSIAAASIIAKVTRDRQMAEWDARFPQYGFARHKGYGVPEHLAAIHRHGPCLIHRRSFAPVAQAAGAGAA